MIDFVPVKVVRDRAVRPGANARLATVSRERPSPADIVLLRRKLVEEALEYLMDPCIDELADVAEVVEALMQHDLRMHPKRLGDAMSLKRSQKGGFEKLTIMGVEVDG